MRLIGTKKLRKFGFLIGLIMVLTSVVLSEGSCDFSSVKVNKIHSLNSGGYVGLRSTSGRRGGEPYELVANLELKYMYSIKLENLDFILFDPDANRYLCLQKGNKKIVARRTLPKNISRCSFVEQTSREIYLKYVNQKFNYTMAFNKRGLQISNKKQIEKHKQSSLLLVKRENNMCTYAKERFCKMNPKKRHRHRKEIANICSFY